MRKLVLVTVAVFAVVCFSASAFAGTINPGDQTSCNNASSITLESKGSHPEDRTNANAVIWKSSNFTTVPITVGPGDHQYFPQGAGGFKKGHNTNGEGMKAAGLTTKFHSMGRKSVTLTSQPNFSRGDSIGDISGEVRITNTGTVPMGVTCN